MVDAVETTDRRLWWRHLISFLIAPVTMTLVIPLSIATSTGVGAPDLTSPVRIGLAIIGGLLIVAGLGLFVWTNTLFDRTGKGTLGIGKLLGEPAPSGSAWAVPPRARSDDQRGDLHSARRGGHRRVPVGCCCGPRSSLPSSRPSSGSGRSRTLCSASPVSTSTTGATSRAGFPRRVSACNHASTQPPVAAEVVAERRGPCCKSGSHVLQLLTQEAQLCVPSRKPNTPVCAAGGKVGVFESDVGVDRESLQGTQSRHVFGLFASSGVDLAVTAVNPGAGVVGNQTSEVDHQVVV